MIRVLESLTEGRIIIPVRRNMPTLPKTLQNRLDFWVRRIFLAPKEPSFIS